ncbi:MAG TPA: helix-turn-helix domain-containing protein [Thermoleophilia bacterium]|nr:helix-turn-helix domain-containing protein [Thermoleophilia bacterium]
METAYDKEGTYLGKLADVFGDPTRRSIYRHLRGCESPQSATEVADVFGLHRTVARAHLEKLGELDLVVTSTRRRAGGGRPAKTYQVADSRLEVMLPPRRYERLARLLLRLVDDALEPEVAVAAAAALGRDYGEQTAEELAGDTVQSPVRLSPRAVLEWLDYSGYRATLASGGDGETVIEVHNCVYAELAAEHSGVVCAFDRNMMCGMLGVDTSVHTQTHALSSGDTFCRHEFRL